jgi:hypothetical protein
MREAFIRKNIELSLEFDRYLAEHPSMLKRMPNGAYVVITISGDDRFNEDSISTVRDLKRKKVVEAHKSSDRWSLRPFKLQSAGSQTTELA